MTWIKCEKCGFYGSTFLEDHSCPNCGNKEPINLTAINEGWLNNQEVKKP